MPLIVRYVEPEELHKTPLLQGVLPRENEFERMAVASLTTVIRQLSSLAKHAESIMGDIADVLLVYHDRSRALEERVRRLKVDIIPSLSDEALSELKILPSGCHFQSDKRIDQQLLCIQRATPALQHQYYAADKVPPLDLMTPYREDGKRPSQLYSDPGFFFENWRAYQLQENTSPRVKLRKHNSSARGDRDIHFTSARRCSTLHRQKHTASMRRQSVSRHQSFGGSDLNMQVERFRSNTAGSSSRTTASKKPEQYHMLTNLSKVQAEVYINTSGAADAGSKPVTPKQEGQKGSLKRSFSLRKPKADKQKCKSGGTLKASGARGSCLLDDGQPTWITDKEASKVYGGLSQQHLEALGLGSPDPTPTPTSTPTTTPTTLMSKSDGVANGGAVTFRAPKAARDRPVSLLLHRWDGHHSVKMSHASKRLPLLISAMNPEGTGSAADLRASSPSIYSVFSSSSYAASDKSKRVAPPPPPLGEDRLVQGEAMLSNDRDDTGFFSISSSTASKVGDGIIESYQSGDVPGAQPDQTRGEGNFVVENGGMATSHAGKMDLLSIQELPRQDSLVTIGTDTLSLLTLNDQGDEVNKSLGRPMSVWQNNPLFTDSSCQQHNTCGDMQAKAHQSQVIDRHNSQDQAPPLPSPQTFQSQVVDIGTHNQSLETSDFSSHSQPFVSHSQHPETTPIVIHMQCTDPTIPCPQPSEALPAQTPMSEPLDQGQPPNIIQGQPPNTTIFVHNSTPSAIQTILIETTPLHNQPQLQPSVPPVVTSTLSPPVLPQSSLPNTSVDLPASLVVGVPTTEQFRTREAKMAEAPLVRKNLLEAIRAGIQLKKVTLQEKNRSTDPSVLAWDVAAILERRMALASESENDNCSDVADSEWDEGEW